MTPVEQQVWDALTAVIDPELNVSIVDLGLIYEVEVRDARVQLVWYPVWSIARMSPKARRQLGIGGNLHDHQNR